MSREDAVDKRPCTFCRSVGQNGAQWILKIGDDQGILVHKPCGDKLAAHAPVGTQVRLFPNREKRDELRVESFWKSKFREAETARAARTQAA